MLRRIALIACASLIALPAAAQAANPAPSSAQPRASAQPRSSAQLNRCHSAPDAAGRYAVFSGLMRSLRGGQDRMDMRFDLFRRAQGSLVFKRVAAPGLGAWNRADPGVGHFRFVQRVENLTAPAAYRAVVSFRWTGATGHVFAKAQRVTPACRQPDLRPNLRVGRITPSRTGDRSTLNYDVTVRNDGSSPARGFGVSLTVGGVPVVPTQTVGLLRAGKRVTLRFTGPRCTAGTPIVASADAASAVAESNEADNALTAACPSFGAKSAR